MTEHLATAGYVLTLFQPAQATHFTGVQTLLQTGLRNLEQWELLGLADSVATWAARAGGFGGGNMGGTGGQNGGFGGGRR